MNRLAVNVPVVPWRLAGTFATLPPNRKTPRPARIKLAIGQAWDFAATPNNREDWSQNAQSAEAAVRNLVSEPDNLVYTAWTPGRICLRLEFRL